MSTEERVARLEQAFAQLLDLARNADERMDMHTDWINQLGAAQAETERKIGNLVDAQIRTEDAVRELAASQRRTEDAVRDLAERFAVEHARTEAALRDLAERFADEQARTQGALRQMADAQRRGAEETAELRRAFSTVARLAEEMDARLAAVEGRGAQ